jgi:leucyl aminopeptidase
MPPNDLYPESFAAKIKELAEIGVEVEVLGEKQLAKLGMNSMLGVGQGSVRESQLGIMKWNGGKEGEDPVILVGKGVCFDTGGISLKPGPGMEDMRGDMGGAAAVTGTIKALAERKAKVNVVGLIGLVENMPDGNAIRPGDILKSASGQTIEVQNTDAEGRLVLCDVLWYAQEHFKPKAIVDLATLTGAIVISLGHHHAGLFTNSDELSEELTKAGLTEGERVWRLPMGPEYDALLKSKFADMRNIGGRAAGSITAAQFLKRFVKDGVKWAHLDIAGAAWLESEKPALDVSWASGFGPRLLDRWIADNYEG